MQKEIDEGRKVVRKMERQCIEEENFELGRDWFIYQIQMIDHTSHSDFYSKVWKLIETVKKGE